MMSRVSIDKQFEKIIAEFQDENFEATQEALDEIAHDGAKALSAATPTGPYSTGQFKHSWEVETKYANVKFIHNTRLAANRIPLSNLAEYSGRHQPFIRSTFNRIKPDLQRKFVTRMQQKLKK